MHTVELSTSSAVHYIHDAIEKLAALAGLEVCFHHASRHDSLEPISASVSVDIENITLEELETVEETRDALANYFGSIAKKFATLQALIHGLDPSTLKLTPREYAVYSDAGEELFRTPNDSEAWAFASSNSDDESDCRIEPPLPEFETSSGTVSEKV